MRTIFKQRLDICDEQTVILPEGSTILHIGVQQNGPCIWYECDIERPVKEVLIHCYGTGYRMPDDMSNLQYIGTVITHGDMGVWHYYREKKG